MAAVVRSGIGMSDCLFEPNIRSMGHAIPIYMAADGTGLHR